MYGTVLPLRKLWDTIISWKSCVDELWIVVPPPQAILFYQYIRFLDELLKKEDVKVRFYTVDILHEKLVSLKELTEHLLGA